MSDSKRSVSSGRGGASTVPRAVIHKKILDAAAANPDASIEALGDRVSGASDELVEQVLDDYGDPAADDQSPEQEHSSSETPADASRTDSNKAMQNQTHHGDAETIGDGPELTEKQRETLRAIADRPEATQAELASELGVTGATINARVNSVPGFEWDSRQEFVDAMFDNETSRTTDETNGRGDEDLVDRVDDLESRLGALEETLDREDPECKPGFDDADLVHKVVHACITFDRISEDEELQILDAVLR